jgi:hypothetical protein
VIVSLQEQLADMTLQRDQAVVRDEDATKRVRTLTHANNNADRIIEQLVQERNEAWNERDLLRQRVEELEEYNANLHEEFHALYNGMDPYAPPDAAGMDVDDDEDEPVVAPSDDDDAATSGSCLVLVTRPCHDDLLLVSCILMYLISILRLGSILELGCLCDA